MKQASTRLVNGGVMRDVCTECAGTGDNGPCGESPDNFHVCPVCSGSGYIDTEYARDRETERAALAEAMSQASTTWSQTTLAHSSRMLTGTRSRNTSSQTGRKNDRPLRGRWPLDRRNGLRLHEGEGMSRVRGAVLSVRKRPRAAQLWAGLWYWGLSIASGAGIVGIIVWMFAEGTK